VKELIDNGGSPFSEIGVFDRGSAGLVLCTFTSAYESHYITRAIRRKIFLSKMIKTSDFEHFLIKTHKLCIFDYFDGLFTPPKFNVESLEIYPLRF